MSPKDQKDLNRIAEAITDEITIDWETEGSTRPDLASRLKKLHLIQKIAEIHRTPWKAPLDDGNLGDLPVLFEWGHLHVIEKLGEGSYGIVYRAYDPNLQREVALKLLREDLLKQTTTARYFLEEARRMARIRHPNVLLIHGADEHDGRTGFWMDLLKGTTLEERLKTEGSLGAVEATVIGIELCRALAAVHKAELVHGDVKAANVMRDHNGRIVLMDFGAGSDFGTNFDIPGTLVGTPLALAPEIFLGGTPSPLSDIYALGVLLYRLVSSQYPVTADALDELRQKHKRGERTPLLDIRPDLPVTWVHNIEKSISIDPGERFQSIGEMEMALVSSIRSDSVTPTPQISDKKGRPALPWLVFFICITAVFIAGIFLIPKLREITQNTPSSSSGVEMTFTQNLNVEAALYRSQNGARELLPVGALVRPGDTLFMELKSSEEVFVYTLNEDQDGNVFVLYPLPNLDLRNPLPGECWHRLPGSVNGTSQDWQVTGGQGKESFLIAVSNTPLLQFEKQLESFTPAAPGQPVIYATLDPDMLLTHRGVGGMVASGSSSEDAPQTILSKIARELSQDSDKSKGLWIRQFVVYNLGS